MTASLLAMGSPVRPMLAGLCATLLGVGLSRFAYAPLLPAMVQAGWLSAGAAGLLGAANLAGYLMGALGAGWIARRIGLVRTFRLAMMLAVVSFALCAFRGGLAWFLPWRVVAGAVGGGLMGLAGPAVQQVIPARLYGLMAGLLFSGVGIGIMAGAVLVPALVPFGIGATWLMLAGAAAVLTLITWRLWPDATPPLAPLPGQRRLRAGVGRLVAIYVFSAAAATSHMVWWPDFIARGLGHGASSGAGYWFLYGAAVATCPALFGRLADLVGSARALAVVMLLQVMTLLLPLLDVSAASLVVSSVCGGATSGSVSALALIRAKDLAGAGSAEVWRTCTAAWGASQAAMGFFLAWLFATTGSHGPIFAAGLACALAGTLLAVGPAARLPLAAA